MRLFAFCVGAVLAWPEPAYTHKSFDRTYPEKTYSKNFTQEDIDPEDLEAGYVELWARSDTFYKPGYRLNPCNDPSMNEEEPWLTICTNPHKGTFLFYYFYQILSFRSKNF